MTMIGKMHKREHCEAESTDEPARGRLLRSTDEVAYAMKGKGQVTGIGNVRVNGQPEELDVPDGRRQPSLGGTSRIS
jgi:hypothetical protein